MRVRIKELVEENNTSFSKLSEKTNITERTLYRWNSGKVKPTKANIEILEKSLNCKTIDLFEF